MIIRQIQTINAHNYFVVHMSDSLDPIGFQNYEFLNVKRIFREIPLMCQHFN